MSQTSISADLPIPDFSIVTVCLNSEKTIRDTMESVLNQKGVTVEHIIKDGGSRDGTLSIVRAANASAKVIEKMDCGVYDAMNQGFQETSGEIVAFLNSDDYYVDDWVLASVLETFRSTSCDLVFGGIRMIETSGRIRRVWRGRELKLGKLDGMQLPHPAVFVRRSVLRSLDQPFDPSYRISADIKQQLILIEKNRHTTAYVAKELTCMRIGGESTVNIRAVIRGWSESARAYREVHGQSGMLFVLRKVLLKLRQVRFLL